VAAQWPFATFLMSGATENWFFGTHYYYFALPSESANVRHVFLHLEGPRLILWRTLLAFVAAIVSTRVGIAWGDWMRRVRR